MKKLHKERLLQVVRVLEELPKEKRFSLKFWYECKSAACAVGWAAQDPWFVRRGLKLHPGHRNYPVYSDCHGIEAAQKFFGLKMYQFSELFEAVSYGNPTKRNVIARIKKFVEEQP